MKVVINTCFGGFGLSEAAEAECERRFGKSSHELGRNHEGLISLIEEIGLEEAAGDYAKLKILNIPDDVLDAFEIEDYDGMESVHEWHRSWS